MRIWVTQIKAIDPYTGELKTWIGDYIKAPTWELAQKWCNENGKGYLEVIGELVAEIPLKDGKPDFDNMIDYEKNRLN